MKLKITFVRAARTGRATVGCITYDAADWPHSWAEAAGLVVGVLVARRQVQPPSRTIGVIPYDRWQTASDGTSRCRHTARYYPDAGTRLRWMVCFTEDHAAGE
jgi:hypothetical protein